MNIKRSDKHKHERFTRVTIVEYNTKTEQTNKQSGCHQSRCCDRLVWDSGNPNLHHRLCLHVSLYPHTSELLTRLGELRVQTRLIRVDG